MSIFEQLEARMALEHDRTFGKKTGLQPMLTPINGESVPDPDRPAVPDFVAIWEIEGASVNAGDNGVGGRRQGSFGLAQAARAVEVSIRKGQIPFDIREGDILTRQDSPGKKWRVAKPLPDGDARDRFRVNEVF